MIKILGGFNLGIYVLTNNGFSEPFVGFIIFCFLKRLENNIIKIKKSLKIPKSVNRR